MPDTTLFERSPAPRAIGAVNGRGLWTLYVKEVRRFLNVYTQTLLAPMVTSLLFLAIFALALGGAGRVSAGVDYITFLAPGLIMMTMMQNAFANTSSSLVIAKVQGNIVDVLMPPLNAGELVLGFAGGGLTRGIVVGLAAGLAMWVFVPLRLHEPLAVLYFAVNASLMLSLLGMIGGLWAEKFDHIAAVTNFLITPLSFLSGTFYSIERLPENAVFIAHFNPFFYLIDGFRYGFIGRADSSVLLGAGVVLAVNLVLWAVIHRLFAIGYRLKP
ncbi:MAG TPA: ABC transporter permease [Kiloniellales bacterium]|nr:ABC transporter permease [Kiloniellales bacterium]